MLIVASTPLYPPRSRVGAWLATHEFLAALAKVGHDVVVAPTLGGSRSYELDGVRVLRRGARTPAGDVHISHSGDTGEFHKAAVAAGIPSVRMVHGQTSTAALEGASLAVFNSHANQAEHAWDGPQIVCHPPTWPEQYRTPPGEHVTLVNLSKAKGGPLLWRLAKDMPGTPFLGVRGGYGRQWVRPARNLEIVSCTPDIRTVFARTRILLMPSERETWGMVAVEAMACGIPVIAHPTPGLVEALGEAGTFADRGDPAAWRRHLDRLADPLEWAAASRAARDRSDELDPAESLARFVDAVEGLA